MTYIIAGSCIKDDSCIEVCPVDCIHPKPGAPDFEEAEQLYIDPAVCIDCDACVEACPVDARRAAHAAVTNRTNRRDIRVPMTADAIRPSQARCSLLGS